MRASANSDDFWPSSHRLDNDDRWTHNRGNDDNRWSADGLDDDNRRAHYWFNDNDRWAYRLDDHYRRSVHWFNHYDWTACWCNDNLRATMRFNNDDGLGRDNDLWTTMRFNDDDRPGRGCNNDLRSTVWLDNHHRLWLRRNNDLWPTMRFDNDYRCWPWLLDDDDRCWLRAWLGLYHDDCRRFSTWHHNIDLTSFSFIAISHFLLFLLKNYIKNYNNII